MTIDVSWLNDRIHGSGSPIISDGGMGTELEKSGVPMDGKVWSACANISHPDAVRQIHEKFITAGAQVIITNTFSAARHMLEPGGLEEHVKDINSNAVKFAQQARENAANQPVAIAGSICEWTSSDDEKWHSPDSVYYSVTEQAEILADAGVDLIALEMCEQTEFSIAATKAVMEIGLPVWIGVSAKKHENHNCLSTFNYEEVNFENHVKSLADYPAMMMNIMHTPVPDVNRALEITRKFWSGPLGVYPECGYFTMPNWNFVNVISPADLAIAAQTWAQENVRMVGGCCGLGPEHIAALHNEFNGSD